MSDLKDILKPNITLVMSNDYVIKVVEENDVSYFGYDVFDERFRCLPKASSILVPKVMFNILINQNMRVCFATTVAKSESGVSKLLGISPRQWYRWRDKASLEYPSIQKRIYTKKLIKSSND